MSAGEVEGRTTRRTTNAYGIAPDVEDRSQRLHIPDFAAPLLLPFAGVELPGLGLPVNETAIGLLCAIAVFRASTSGTPVPKWFVALVLAIPLWLAVTSAYNDLDPYRRLLHAALYAALALLLASGRIHIPSAAKGLGLGIVASTGLSLLGLGVDVNRYAGRLSGVIGDPNLAGYLLTVLGCVAVGVLSKGRMRSLLAFGLVVAVVLTLSRTALLATALAALWLVIGRRMQIWAGSALVVGYVYVVSNIPRELSLFGPFSDRTGSDALRERLIAQERLDVASAPWTGSGAGTARVDLDDGQFFYHSSYLAAQREGGWILVGIVVLLAALTFLALSRGPGPHRNGWLEAGIICLMVVAVNLGEVLLDLPAAFILGTAMWWSLKSREPSTPEAVPIRVRGRGRRLRAEPPGPS